VQNSHSCDGVREQIAAIVLRSEAASVPAARRFVASMLNSWESEDDEEVVALLTSEMVSNAVRHAVGDVTVEVMLVTPEELRVGTWDQSPELPVVRHARPDVVGGHGLQIVEALAQRWGVERCPDHKIVWFEARVRARSAPPLGV
jgi:anti-sigma regulatory factor (Ser/Thr protein kinase)